MVNAGACSEEQLEDALISVAVESWRLSRLFKRALKRLDASEASRFVNQVQFFQKRLEDSLERTGLRIVNIEEQAFDDGLPASALNLEDFDPGDELFIDQMIEPIIMNDQGVRKPGTVLLRKRTV